MNSRLACHVHRVHRSTHEVWKARIWLAATHYFESEIINKLITHIKVHREAIKSKTLGGNIIYSFRFSILYKKLQNRKYIQLQQQQSAGMQFN